jgi:hypothetical protein
VRSISVFGSFDENPILVSDLQIYSPSASSEAKAGRIPKHLEADRGASRFVYAHPIRTEAHGVLLSDVVAEILTVVGPLHAVQELSVGHPDSLPVFAAVEKLELE